MFLKKVLAASILTTPILILSGCGGDSTTASATDAKTAALTVALTDGPVDNAVAVVIEVTGLTIKPAEGEVITVEFDAPRSIDLLQLQGSDATDLISELALAAGDYAWVRLNINATEDGVMDSYIEFDDGTSVELDMPGDAEGGLKIARHFTLIEGEEGVFTIDFDLRKSLFHRQNRPATERGTTMLRPSLRMVPNHRAGHLRGDLDAMLVADLCAESATSLGAVYVFGGADATLADVNGSATDPVASALVKINDDGEYHYHIGFLEAGDYSVAYTCDAASDNPDEVNELTFAALEPISIEARAEKESSFHQDTPRKEWDSRVCNSTETPEAPAEDIPVTDDEIVDDVIDDADITDDADVTDDAMTDGAVANKPSYQRVMNWCASEDREWMPTPGRYHDEDGEHSDDQEYNQGQPAHDEGEMPETDANEYPEQDESEESNRPVHPVNSDWDKEETDEGEEQSRPAHPTESDNEMPETDVNEYPEQDESEENKEENEDETETETDLDEDTADVFEV